MVDAFRPADLDECLEILSKQQLTVLAGGTDLMSRNRVWSGALPAFKRPVLFIGHLEELKNSHIDEDYITIGSACTLAQILRNKEIPDFVKLPLPQMASPAIRSVATMGGNICNASPAGDTLPMLFALDAQVVTRSQKASREIPIAEFITGPGKTSIHRDEILIEIKIPKRVLNRCYFKKVGVRRANAISKASFYAAALFEEGRIQELRMAFGAVSPVPVRSRKAEALLAGLEVEQVAGVMHDVKKHYQQLIDPIDDIRSTSRYRRKTSLLILENFLMKELISDV